MIRVTNLSLFYSDRGKPVRAVDDVSFEVPEGIFYTLLGPSGSGKTSTLRCIAGLERPSSGEITLGNVVVVSGRKSVPTYRRDIGMVFQSYAVWPHMTVFENVAFPLRVGRQRLRKPVIEEKVGRALALVGLSGYEGRGATQLSGGQQQRLSFARALVREPQVLLLDEPLSNLDAKLRGRMRTELSLLQRRLGITTLFVTHDQIEALSMSDRVAVMNDGRIMQEGSPRTIYHRPESVFVANFIGSTNLLSGEVIEGSAASSDEPVQASTSLGPIACTAWTDVKPGLPVVVTIRPEDVVVRYGAPDNGLPSRSSNTYEGRVDIGLFNGMTTDLRIRIGDEVIYAVAGSRLDVERGDQVTVELPAAACWLLPADEHDKLDGEASGRPTTPG